MTEECFKPRPIKSNIQIAPSNKSIKWDPEKWGKLFKAMEWARSRDSPSQALVPEASVFPPHRTPGHMHNLLRSQEQTSQGDSPCLSAAALAEPGYSLGEAFCSYHFFDLVLLQDCSGFFTSVISQQPYVTLTLQMGKHSHSTIKELAQGCLNRKIPS